MSSNPSGATFGWSNNNTSIGLGANGLGDIPSFTALNTTNAPVIATLTFVPSSGSCIGSPLNYTITVNPSPLISASNNGPICESGLLNLVGNGPSSSFYSWVGPNGFTSNSQNPFISNFSAINAGNYTLTVTSNEGCSSVASTSVTYNAASVSNLIADVTSGCEPLKVRFTDLTTPQSTSIIWNFGDGTTSNQLDTVTHVYSDTGSYNVSISTNSNGCSSEITFINYITVYGSAVANFDLNTYSQSIFNPVFQALNSSSNASFYQWYSSNNLSSNAVHPIFTFPADAGGYTIFLIANNEANCPDTTSKVIRIDDELVFFIPNSFTPDGDELNNTFQPVFTSGFDAQSFEMLIYNRFGEVIFETHDLSVGWDGTYHNKLVKEGVYSWTVQFKDSNNDKKFTQNGSVTIIR